MTFIETLNSLFDFVDLISPSAFFNGIICFMTVMFVWENYLTYRQVRFELVTFDSDSSNQFLLLSVPCGGQEQDSATGACSVDRARDLLQGSLVRDRQERLLLLPFVCQPSGIDGETTIKHAIFTYSFTTIWFLKAVLYLGIIPFFWNLAGSQLKSLSYEWLHGEVRAQLMNEKRSSYLHGYGYVFVYGYGHGYPGANSYFQGKILNWFDWDILQLFCIDRPIQLVHLLLHGLQQDFGVSMELLPHVCTWGKTRLQQASKEPWILDIWTLGFTAVGHRVHGGFLKHYDFSTFRHSGFSSKTP